MPTAFSRGYNLSPLRGCIHAIKVSAAMYDFRVSLHSSRNARHDRIVISGFGCVTPLGNSREELWDGYRNGRSGVQRISAFDPSKSSVQIAGEVRGLDP